MDSLEPCVVGGPGLGVGPDLKGKDNYFINYNGVESRELALLLP